MAKLRMKFIKEEQAAWISHLDLMRTFQRCFLRAGLTVKHSQGFHPHPLMSILLPLSVGQSSVCELLDFETVEDVDTEALIRSMNEGMPVGIRVLECYDVTRPVRELKVLHARVEFEYDGGVPADAAEKLAELFRRESIIIQKRTKRKAMADVDIRPMLEEVVFSEEENKLVLTVRVQAQDPGLNPALLAAAVEKELPELKPDFVRVRRLALLDGEGAEFR